jgi:catechol 2,3-dioxygenase-like lactoylglutathione lyase family enzyme
MPSFWYDHVHLYSPDPMKAAEFYEKMFAAKRVSARKIGEGITAVELSLNGSRVLITERPGKTREPSGPGDYSLEHFSIRTDDIEKAAADLKAAGIRFRDELRQSRPGVKIAYFWAPDEVLIELIERPV